MTGGRGGAALVTGAASGLGRLAALRLAAAGTPVAALDVDGANLARTARRAPGMRAYACDVTDEAAVREAVAAATAELGPIELVVHAAGLCRVGRALDQPLDELRRVLEVNYLGTVHVARATVPAMVDRGRGTLLVFGSIAGWVPSPRLAAYATSKFAVTAFCEVLAQETAGTGVRVVCACPDHVETPLADGVRAADPTVLGGRTGADPAAVLDAVDRALASPRPPLFLFPGRSARYLWRARRLAPRLLGRVITRHVRA
ncbi:NADP-dependent 3-hydroxy acid dehydrogenase YdfG [Amycolatopsis arida]|uniref:NADP-dependent 3-hydroxy acid dehydrogenase YdfG n=1 Tax=Amycolatopsis arida TaxID=587909 RepID=A0A1I5V500_9PSEU|nr:SDR family NAD(P)-dependent oxidoreductase [Amycolatopsis arida]TDX91151.1 NADP-dependent 3-hydroxy acid dehydrogenase YdfG [Amycolatopsis arida]SFQ02589.1 NADP-dependent 3-hydroxy acid dehydrogenase YdfG [Amycolatopsis arida]